MIYILLAGIVLNTLSSIYLSYLDFKDGIDLSLGDFVIMVVVTLVPYLTFGILLIELKKKYSPDFGYKTVLIKGKKK